MKKLLWFVLGLALGFMLGNIVYSNHRPAEPEECISIYEMGFEDAMQLCGYLEDDIDYD